MEAEQPGNGSSAANPVRPVLIVDDNTPGEILVDGIRVVLQDKQYRLIRLLAEHAGACVPYETIYETLWGDTIVENSQIHFQKRNLIKRIKEAAPGRAGLIRTVTKRGYVLELEAGEALHIASKMSSAA